MAKPVTFLPESLPVSPYHSSLYKIIFDTVLSSGLLPRTLSQNPAASATFLPHEFCFLFFHFFSLSQYPPPVNPTHIDAEMTVLPIILSHLLV